MEVQSVAHVEKACAYITRNGTELLVFEGPGHDGFQIPKGTVERHETPRDAVSREIVEESGLATLGRLEHLVTDVWTRRASKRYVRNFYHVPVHESREEWTHVVTGSGEERGSTFEFSWVDIGTDATFALDLDDYLHALPVGRSRPAASGVAAD